MCEQVELAPHRLSVALYQPQIAPNTGNIARLCVATGTTLNLIRPLGFVLSDRQLRRSAMDYWPRLQLREHEDWHHFLDSMGTTRIWSFTSHGTRTLWQAEFADGDCLLFGNETHGLPIGLRQEPRFAPIRIPQAPRERCLNLSTAVGIGLYEALRRCQQS